MASRIRISSLIVIAIISTLAFSVQASARLRRRLSKQRRQLLGGGGFFSLLEDPYFDDIVEQRFRKNKPKTHHYQTQDFVKSIPFEGPPINFFLENNTDWLSHQEAILRIVGGRNAFPHSFYSILLYQDELLGWKWAGCGATLVSNCHVLTAAHCMDFNNSGVTIEGVLVNAHAPYHDNFGVPYFFSFIDEIIVHDNYNLTSREGDIALIKMSSCLDVRQFPVAEPATPHYTVNSYEQVNVLGLGLINENVSASVLPEILQKADVEYIPTSQCRLYYGMGIKSDMICAGYEQGGIDACQGDSGSGLVREDSNGKFTHFGIVSWGDGCGRSRSPGVYSSIAYYYHWLHNLICEDPATNIEWCEQADTTAAPRRNCKPIDTPCFYGSDCCSGSCRVLSIGRKQCTAPLNMPGTRDSFAKGMGGSGGGASHRSNSGTPRTGGEVENNTNGTLSEMQKNGN